MDAWFDDFMARDGADASTRALVAAFFGDRADPPALESGASAEGGTQ